MSALVVYFSRPGENWFDGTIRSLKTGNTEVLARAIAEAAGADIFRIETVKPYPEAYRACTDLAKKELAAGVRPELKSCPKELGAYDTVYVGYPVWWGTAPMAVFTFLEAFGWEGKTVRPFCTHEGSGLGRSVEDIAKACPGAKVEAGLAAVGSEAARAAAKAARWVKGA